MAPADATPVVRRRRPSEVDDENGFSSRASTLGDELVEVLVLVLVVLVLPSCLGNDRTVGDDDDDDSLEEEVGLVR